MNLIKIFYFIIYVGVEKSMKILGVFLNRFYSYN